MKRGLQAAVGFVLTAGALVLPAASAGAATNPLTDAFDQGAGNSDGTFTVADCPPYGAEERQRICSGEVPSFDGAPLDVDLTLPFNDSRATDHPLMVMMNGFGNDKHEWQSVNDEGDGADKYHWNSHWFAKHGYYVLTYTPRGFDTDRESAGYQPDTPEFSSNHPEKNGTIHLKSREFEVRDTQWLSALVAAGFEVEEDEVAVTGGSYGGGESWLQASQAEWTFPSECSEATATAGPEACRPGETETPDVEPLDVLKLQVAVPKYPWTDLAYSLAPSGHPGPAGGIYDSATHAPDKQEKQPCPAPLAAPQDNPICNPFGVLKESYVNGFYAIGNSDGTFEDGTWTTPSEEGPINIHDWKDRAETDPYDAAGAEDPIVQQIRDGLTEYRGAYYQDEEWAEQEDGRKVAIYSIQGWTDDLFTAVESFRMFRYLKALDPLWPVEVELADVGHPRAQNKPETWRRLNAQAFQFLGSHIEGSHEQETAVSSQPTLCENDGDPDSNETAAERITARSPTGLSNGAIEVSYAPGGATTSVGGLADPNGPATDPVLADRVFPRGDACRPSDGPALGGYTAYSEPLPDHSTYVGLGTVTVPYVLTGTTATLNARVWDVAPDGPELLMTRGTYRIDVPAYDSQAGTLELPLFGNHWPLAPGHSIRLDLTQVDTPFLAPSKVPSSIEFGPPTLTLPTRESGTVGLSGSP